jgi:polyhydroxyalkanoate synthase
VSSVQAIVFSVQLRNRTESQPAEFTQLISDQPLSEPGHKGRHYRISHRPAGALYLGPDAWLDQHDPQPGSWWPEWVDWLHGQGGKMAPPPAMGAPDKGYPPLIAAPGSYVFQP